MDNIAGTRDVRTTVRYWDKSAGDTKFVLNKYDMAFRTASTGSEWG